MSHLVLPYDHPCSFCEYLSGARPFTILHREEHAAVLVTREQRGVSHLLVITTRHCPTLLDLLDEEAQSVMDLIRRAALAIDRADHRAGITVWQKNGLGAHQTIPHFHFHVAGTIDGGGTKWDEVDQLSIEETDAIARRVKPFFY